MNHEKVTSDSSVELKEYKCYINENIDSVRGFIHFMQLKAAVFYYSTLRIHIKLDCNNFISLIVPRSNDCTVLVETEFFIFFFSIKHIKELAQIQ